MVCFSVFSKQLHLETQLEGANNITIVVLVLLHMLKVKRGYATGSHSLAKPTPDPETASTHQFEQFDLLRQTSFFIFATALVTS